MSNIPFQTLKLSNSNLIPVLFATSRNFYHSSLVPELMSHQSNNSSSSSSNSTSSNSILAKNKNQGENIFLRSDHREFLKLFSSSDTLQYTRGLSFDSVLKPVVIYNAITSLLIKCPFAYRSIKTLSLSAVNADVANCLVELPFLENLHLDSCFTLYDSSLAAVGKALTSSSNSTSSKMKLKSLSIVGNNMITFNGIKHLQGVVANGLRALDLSSCMNVDNACIKTLFSPPTASKNNNSNNQHALLLEELNLSCTGITGLSFLARQQQQHSTAARSSPSTPTSDDNSSSSTSLLPHLRVLKIGSCCQLNRDDLKYLAPNLSNSLEVLDLSYNIKQVTDISIKALQSGLRHLTTLDLSFCSSLTNAALEDTLSKAAFTDSLQTLSLTKCDNLDDTGLAHLNSFKNLRSLSLNGISKMTNLSFLARRKQQKKTAKALKNANTNTNTNNNNNNEHDENVSNNNSNNDDETVSFASAYARESSPLSQLRVLNLNDCVMLSNIKGFLGLESADDEKDIVINESYLENLRKIKDKVDQCFDMSYLPFPFLHTISLVGCVRIGDDQLKFLTKLCYSSVQTLDISRLPLITSYGIRGIMILPGQDLSTQWMIKEKVVSNNNNKENDNNGKEDTTKNNLSNKNNNNSKPQKKIYYSSVETLTVRNCTRVDDTYFIHFLSDPEASKNLREVHVGTPFIKKYRTKVENLVKFFPGVKLTA